MKFWNIRTITLAAGMLGAAYLTVAGFMGKLPSLFGAIGWLLLLLNNSVDMVGYVLNHQAEKEYDEALARLQNELEECEEDCDDECKCNCCKGE